MRDLGIWLLGVTTVLLFTITIFASMNMAFSWIFYLTVIGQILLGLSVYFVLTDNYTTDKTFEDFYGDRSYRGE